MRERLATLTRWLRLTGAVASGGVDAADPSRSRTLRWLRAGERGQTLVISAVAMLVVLLVAALAIDSAVWYQQHHQDQVAADAAALAAANCLANAGGTSSNDTCTSTADTTDAASVATTIASAYGVTIPTGDVKFSGGMVSVTTPSSSPTLFARVAGIRTSTTSASAVAGYTTASQASAPCTGAAQSAEECAAVYAANQTCGSTDGFIAGSGGGDDVTVAGAVHSQGSMTFSSSGGSYDFQAPVTYSSGNCTPSIASNAAMTGAYSPTAGGNQSASFWPANYASFFTACSGAACTGPNGTPSYCAAAAASYSFNWSSAPTGIYCAYGTGTPTNPATWNGSFDFDSSFGTSSGNKIGSSSSPWPLTIIGGSLLFQGTAYLTPATGADGCLTYMNDTDPQSSDGVALEIDGGSPNLSGALFAPNGTIEIMQVNISESGFLEGANVNLSNFTGTFTGSGPVLSGSTGGVGSESLLQ